MQGQAWRGSVGRDRAGQRQAGCDRAAPDRTSSDGKDRTVPGRATKSRLVPGKAEQDLKGAAIVSTTGQGGNGVFDSAGPARAGHLVHTYLSVRLTYIHQEHFCP